MAVIFKFEIVTPDRTFPVMDVVFLDVPAENGRLTILANHENMLCGLTAGSLISRDVNNSQTEWEIGGGTMSVDQKKVTLLVRDIKISE